MLTVAKLAVLMKYQWNLRQFHKQGTPEEKELVADLDWDDLSEILNDLKLYHKKLVSAEYAKKIHAELLAVCADEETTQTLLGYASIL
jgi:hypothetical protein